MAFYGWLMGDKEINSWKLTSLRGSCAMQGLYSGEM